jgi:C-terminal processing protease CtpA/Prc
MVVLRIPIYAALLFDFVAGYPQRYRLVATILVVNMCTLPGGYTITWTGMKVLKHDGSRHHGVGIIPTIPVSRTRAGVAAGRDEFLERAMSAVKD